MPFGVELLPTNPCQVTVVAPYDGASGYTVFGCLLQVSMRSALKERHSIGNSDDHCGTNNSFVLC